MHKNRVWIIFLSIFFLVFLWHGAGASYQLYKYSSLTEKTTPIEIEWTLNKKASDLFYVHAQYIFNVGSSKIVGNTDFLNISYKSPEACMAVIQENSKKKWLVWYSSNNIQISTLQKSFPWKESIYSIILLFLMLYFIWLGIYVGKFGVYIYIYTQLG